MTKPVINLPGKDESDADENTGSPHVQPYSIYECKVSSVKRGCINAEDRGFIVFTRGNIVLSICNKQT